MQNAVTLRLQSQKALQTVPNGAVAITGGNLESITGVPDSGDQQFDVRFSATQPQVSLILLKPAICLDIFVCGSLIVTWLVSTAAFQICCC